MKEDVAEVGVGSIEKTGQSTKNVAGQDVDEPISTHGSTEKNRFARMKENQFAGKLWDIVTWIPRRCRWDPKSPPEFSMGLNLLFGFVSMSYFFSCKRWILQSGFVWKT